MPVLGLKFAGFKCVFELYTGCTMLYIVLTRMLHFDRNTMSHRTLEVRHMDIYRNTAAKNLGILQENVVNGLKELVQSFVLGRD